jgi:DNA-binding IclR family transcriptional regulator
MARAVPAVTRALDVLELFLDRNTLTAPEVAERLKLPRTTVHELVNTLVDRSYLIASESSPIRYRLGMRLFQLGNRFAEQLDLAREAQQVAAEVAGACDETVHIAVLDGAHVVYVAKVDSTHPVRMVSAVGRRLPAHCTAVGKVLLAALSTEALEARYPPGQSLPAMTPNSVTSPARLRAVLSEVRAQGVSYDNCESNDAVRCVAAPVADHSGAVVAAISISVPIIRWTPEREKEWTPLVRTGALTLSHRLGYAGGSDAIGLERVAVSSAG